MVIQPAFLYHSVQNNHFNPFTPIEHFKIFLKIQEETLGTKKSWAVEAAAGSIETTTCVIYSVRNLLLKIGTFQVCITYYTFPVP